MEPDPKSHSAGSTLGGLGAERWLGGCTPGWVRGTGLLSPPPCPHSSQTSPERPEPAAAGAARGAAVPGPEGGPQPPARAAGQPLPEAPGPRHLEGPCPPRAPLPRGLGRPAGCQPPAGASAAPEGPFGQVSAAEMLRLHPEPPGSRAAFLTSSGLFSLFPCGCARPGGTGDAAAPRPLPAVSPRRPREPPAVPPGRPPPSRSPARCSSPGHGAGGRALTPSRLSLPDGPGVPRAPQGTSAGKSPAVAAAPGRATAPSPRTVPAPPRNTQQGRKSSVAAARPQETRAPTAVTPRAPSPLKARAPSSPRDAPGDSPSPREGGQRAPGRGPQPPPRNSSGRAPKLDSGVKPPGKGSPAPSRPRSAPGRSAEGCGGCAAGDCPQGTRQCPPGPRAGGAEGPRGPEGGAGAACGPGRGAEGLRGCCGEAQPPGYDKVVEELSRGPQPLRPVGMGGRLPQTPPRAAPQPPAPGEAERPGLGAQTPRGARASTAAKPRRCLKKPERVPSIYKLKLRPKVRPRRDHRPGKRPSRIPTPLGHRPPAPRGQHRPPGPPRAPQSGSTRPTAKPSRGDSGTWLTDDDEESWV